MANIIAENLFAQVDNEGYRYILLDDIIDHRCTEGNISGDNGFITLENGMKQRCHTTQGRELCLQWKDQFTNRIKLKYVKNAYPIEVAEYAIANKVHDQPAFSWWATFTLKKWNRFISKVKSKYWQRTHKYGIDIPRSVKHALT